MKTTGLGMLSTLAVSLTLACGDGSDATNGPVAGGQISGSSGSTSGGSGTTSTGSSGDGSTASTAAAGTGSGGSSSTGGAGGASGATTGGAGGSGNTGGASGTGGSGGGNACTGPLTGMPVCDECLGMQCCPQIQACAASTQCSGLIDCLRINCAGSSNLTLCAVQNCTPYLNGLQQAQAIQTCQQQHCATACM